MGKESRQVTALPRSRTRAGIRKQRRSFDDADTGGEGEAGGEEKEIPSH